MTHSNPQNEKVNGERDRTMLTPAKSTNGAVPISSAQPRSRSTRPNNDQGSLNLVSILASFRRVWPLGIILGLLLGPALAAIGWFVLAPKQSAMALLKIAMDEVPLAFKTADQMGGGIAGFKIYKNTQKQLIASPRVINSALENDKVKALASIREAESPMEWLAKDLKVTFPDDGEVMAIELSSKSTSDSIEIVDAIVRAYMNEVVEKTKQEKDTRLAALQDTWADTLKKVRDKRQEISDTADRLGTGDSEALTIAQQAEIQRYGQLQTDLDKVTYELLDAEDRLQQMKAALSDTDPNGTKNTSEESELEIHISQLELEQALSRDTEYQQLSQEARELNRKLREMERASFGERFTGPLLNDAQKLKSALADRREFVAEIVKKDLEMRRSSGRMIPGDSKNFDSSAVSPRMISMQELTVSHLKRRKELIDFDLKKCQEQTKNLGRSSAELEVMRSELESLEEILARVTSELEATRIEKRSSAARVEEFSSAAPVEGSDKKKRLAATLAGGLFGFALPLCALVFFDMQKKHLDDPKKIKSELNIDVLGMLPTANGPVRMLEPPGSERGKQTYANVVESVHSIVAMLVKKASIDERQIFMVSSAGPSEGKSTLSQNLWAGLSEANYRCLLVDMDFRRPSIHRYLNVDIGLGVSDVLSGKVDVESAIRSIDGQRSFMTAGESRQLNLAALANDALPRFFDHLRGHYDFIIVDTAPILPIVDSRVIGEHVDGAVLSTIRDRSRLPQLIAAIELLKAHETDILGVVVSGFGSSAYGYSYYRS